MHEKQRRAMDRRGFLRAVGGAATVPATAAAAMIPGAAQAYDPGKEETKGRYRETDHVKAFYRVNGYPTQKK